MTLPVLGANSFECPHSLCGALAQQTWFHTYILKYTADERPPQQQGLAALAAALTNDDRLKLYANRRMGRGPDTELDNLSIAQCFSCDRYSIWIADELIYPVSQAKFAPADDMPDAIKTDFIEAAAIVETSPRGASALLRLCIQKLLVALGEKGENINEDIKSLVKKGLDPNIQKALDVVRVTGNNAVHPGDLKVGGDSATAKALFGIVNFIVEQMISRPKRLNALYDSLPENARSAIGKRDGSK